MKKKNRWQLSSQLSNESYQGDNPIAYSKHQCIYNDNPVKDCFLYDSLSNTKLGSSEVSNRHLAKGGFNLKNVLSQLETEDFNGMNQELMPEGKCIYDKELRKDCVFIHEYVNINDLSEVNLVKAINFRCFRRSKLRKAGLLNQLSYDEMEYDNEMEYDYEENEIENSKEEELAKPFIISGDDFNCRSKEGGHKQKTQKRQLL